MLRARILIEGRSGCTLLIPGRPMLIRERSGSSIAANYTAETGKLRNRSDKFPGKFALDGNDVE
ncbi:hypothetical protein PACILC2_11240 [Paenibacillus cisolokensis]|uniref:Uncharacterized protein n=1 Tax=Paenibacillus cisolokensis TaxID=1658519 RepID=A0ABQ4N2Z7_9BACL|nr:hypothetical protein [Paenibacillus cisolokensis]GIQ62556.1 hypothetical protein PACILC2_11240 [Paenibacillus cisolokensis]